MKKHLIAAAVAAAVAAPAMAQNVTVSGALDASVVAVQKANAAGNNVSGFVDSAIVSSVWGLKGSEDLGGGLRAIFDLQGDIQTNNGGMNQNGIFRRQANVGVAGGFGEVALGVKTNPIIATNAALMPVSGNSVSTVTSQAMNYADFFTRNAVTYTSPNMSGLQVQLQYGFDNTASATATGGRMYAASAAYTTGPLTVRAAMQDRSQNGSTSSSNTGFEKTGSVFGASYKLGDVTLAAAGIKNEFNTALNGAKTKVDGTQVGIGYQASAAWLLGASYTQAESSNLTNVQARYALSKRTTAYVQYGRADNDAKGTVNFAPTATNTGNAPATVLNGFAATAGKTQSSVGVGLIHSF